MHHIIHEYLFSLLDYLFFFFFFAPFSQNMFNQRHTAFGVKQRSITAYQYKVNLTDFLYPMMKHYYPVSSRITLLGQRVRGLML